ncbi:MAG: DUF4838 domain-containing protein [Planctomycetes bacterium]|nr:DUF4838 domain-containing protein [Planctomycetota bacterium]
MRPSAVQAAAGAGQPARSARPCRITIGGRAVSADTHAIVLPEKPTPQETYAAADLREHIRKLTGQVVPVIGEEKLGRQTPLVIGRAVKTLKKLGLDVDFKTLGDEGIVIRTKGPAIVLAGNKRGVLYAVYTFLEDYCGCRWLTPDCTVIPSGRTFDIARLNVRYVPPLEYRSTDYPKSRPGAWAVRNKINGTPANLLERQGGKIAYSHFVHTFNSILDPARYFAEHPEWFSMVNGKRVGGRTQLCLTNPEVLALAKKTVRRWIAEAPGATVFSVSQNDWGNYCQCPRCSALAKKEGSQSGPLLHFVNAIADDIARDWPDKVISTLAYHYTRRPPLHVRPRPNVCVRLCSIECCFAHPLASCPENRSFVEDIRNWHKICDRLYIWDYVINFAHSVQPFPNLYVIQPNVRFFVDNGVKGVYEEACYYSKGSELAELRTWIIAKTLWRPDYDTDKAIDEFLAGYYGPAAGAIRKYIDLVHGQVREHADWHLHIYDPPTAPFLRKEVMDRAGRLFDAAEAAVGNDPVLLHRVRVARLPVLYVQIVTAPRAAGRLTGRARTNVLAQARRRLETFEAVARAEGMRFISENSSRGRLDTWLASMRKKLAAPARPGR